MKAVSLFFVLASICVSSGCSSPKYHVQFDSNPPVAKLICNGTDYGYTPVDLFYDLDVQKSETLNIGECTANLASGAIAKYDSYLDIKKFPGGVKTTAQRP